MLYICIGKRNKKNSVKLVTITNTKYRKEFKIFLKFNDWVTGMVDLKNHLDGEIFKPLKNQDYF